MTAEHTTFLVVCNIFILFLFGLHAIRFQDLTYKGKVQKKQQT